MSMPVSSRIELAHMANFRLTFVVGLSATPTLYAPPAMTYVIPRDFTEPRVAEQPF